MTIEPVLSDTLTAHAEHADATLAWPVASWHALAQAGGLRWCIPTAYGGDGLQGVELLLRYRDLAAACLTTCFILRQRDAGCRRTCPAWRSVRRSICYPCAAR